jgi:hypothetical protein
MTPKINEPPGPKRSASLYQIIPGVKAKNENPKKSATASSVG